MPRLTALLHARSVLRRGASAALLTLLVGAGPAWGHFILLSPDSWTSQDAYGSPQKLGPCGNESGGTLSGKITAYQPGQTIPIIINEVIHHPGHYRAALSVHDRSELPPEPIVTPSPTDPCASVAIQDPPVFPVLLDNALPHTDVFSGPQTFYVTLPSDVTCTKCTLQVLEYMSSHGAPCFYHHCADISIQGSPVECGNGTIEAGEECDDNNTNGGDGCDSLCQVEGVTPTPTTVPTAGPCVALEETTLSIGNVAAPSGDESLRFSGAVTLSSAEVADLQPNVDGVRFVIDDLGGNVLDVTIPGGGAWSTSRSGTKWAFRTNRSSAPGGISRVVIQRRSNASPGQVRFKLRGAAANAAVGSGNLPVTARLIVMPTTGACGEATSAMCRFNASGTKLRCD